ncbi:MAG: DUF1573 domain-containing protein [Planctomycetes bacterium]|nr:DUF1573 domain-containing protein [Planctomycetota bacterium]
MRLSLSRLSLAACAIAAGYFCSRLLRSYPAQPESADSIPPSIGQRTIDLLRSEAVVDLGEVPFGATVVWTGVVQNRRNLPVRVTTERASCGCLVAQTPAAIIAGGQTADISIAFSTQDRSGPTQAFVTLVSHWLQDDRVGEVDVTRTIVEVRASISRSIGLSRLAPDFPPTWRGDNGEPERFSLRFADSREFQLTSHQWEQPSPWFDCKLGAEVCAGGTGSEARGVLTFRSAAVPLEQSVVVSEFVVNGLWRSRPVQFKLVVRAQILDDLNADVRLVYWPRERREQSRTVSVATRTGETLSIEEVSFSPASPVSYRIADNETPTPRVLLELSGLSADQALRTRMTIMARGSSGEVRRAAVRLIAE